MADRLWSQAIKVDWNYRCAVCGKTGTDAHHLIPRQFQATRYDLRNGVLLCNRDHIWNHDLAPHQNAVGWIEWLEREHWDIMCWCMKNIRPQFTGKTTAQYYCGVIRGLKQYVEESDYERIVGIRFSRWLEENA